MDFRELTYILSIAKHKNLTRAAEALYIGQPTLSKFLSSLEAELGLRLFNRIGNRYELSYAGERYVEKATQILNLKNDLDAEMGDILRRDVGVLNVAFAKMRYSYLLPVVLPEFSRRYPNISTGVIEGNSAENDRKLLDGQIDVAFYTMPYDRNESIDYHPLCREELLICTCKNHPLSEYAVFDPNCPHPRLDPKLLENERVILMRPEQRTRQIVDGIMHEHNIKLSKAFYTTSIPAIMELTANGYGVSFVFDTHLNHRFGSSEIDCYSFGVERVFADFVAATRKGAYLSHHVKDFIEIVRQSCIDDI